MDVMAATLGGLWHDIGKMEQRGRGGRAAHTDLGADFYARCLAEKVAAVYGANLSRDVESAIRDHHAHSEVITLADHIAAGERFDLEKEETQDPRETPLIPIWHGVTPEGARRPEGPLPATPLVALSESTEVLFPRVQPAGTLVKDYARLWQAFEAEVRTLPADETLLERCQSLLERYAWCVPSAAYRSRPDVSLFDHLRLTAAVAACLAPVTGPTFQGEHFVLVLGDLSGIQSYLFALRRMGTGASAKRLRARSHRIAELALDTARDILKLFGLHRPNLLLSAGGKFYLLLPARADAEDLLRRRQTALDRDGAGRFAGLLSVRLAWTRCSGKDLGDFGPLRRRLEGQVRLAKSRPLAGALQSGGAWNEEAFVGRPFAGGQEPCPVCGLRPVPAPASPDAETECEECAADRWSGQQLARNGRHYIPCGAGGAVLDFETLAEKAVGRTYLGVLKADVDRLGRIFDRGLAVLDGDTAGGRVTISRMMAASRSLDWFFTRWLPQFLRASYPHTYTVYAGGDDLLLVGPWNEMADLAAKMEGHLRRYVAGNAAITWSAGIAVVPSRTPINLAIEEADRLLQQAKDTDALGRDRRGRNQVACLGTVLPWDRFIRGLAEARQLAAWVRARHVSASVTQMLMWAARRFQSFRRDRTIAALRWVPFLSYQIGRLFQDRRSPESDQAYQWLVGIKEKGLRDLPADQVTDLDALRLIADYAAYSSWEGGTNGAE